MDLTRMKRSKPLKRVPFRRKEPSYSKEPHPLMELEGDAALSAAAFPRIQSLRKSTYSGTTTGAVPKREYVRSEKLLAAVRSLPCMVTGTEGQTEPAHSNWSQHGKARSIKADDNRVAALRRDIHRELDQGHSLTAGERQELWWAAHVRTVKELLARGLWPRGVPVPQLEDFWKA